MKLLTQGSRHLQRCMGALLLCFVGMAAPAVAQNDESDGSVQRPDAGVWAVAQVRHGQWVELPTGGWPTRQFIQEQHRRKNDNSVLIKLRVDYLGAASEGAGSEVQTVGSTAT